MIGMRKKMGFRKVRGEGGVWDKGDGEERNEFYAKKKKKKVWKD